MAIYSETQKLSICVLFFMFSLAYARLISSDCNFKAETLANRLVAEALIKPSLFDGPDKDFVEGTRLQLKSVTVNKYLCAEDGGGTNIVANRASPSDWETYRLGKINDKTFNLRVYNKKFIGLDTKGNGVDVVAVSSEPGAPSNTFEIVRNPDDKSRVRIKAPNGKFLQVKTEKLVTADYVGNNGGWGNDNPSVFLMTITGGLQGDIYLTVDCSN
ncbi:uncharacterized protein LOC120001023 [Tripterygium wilfordii]|uniref:uncharacterized protein LOC120001023 n=1 Tax=Tripterygium wilfordii TaxID=458696 RepID=UPI0018F85071|nr:uncharacterized protein LOC120001023 [Tripterygium wilfordii]